MAKAVRLTSTIALLFAAAAASGFTGAYVRGEGALLPAASPGAETAQDIGLAVDSRGALYAFNPATGAVSVFGPDGGRLRSFTLGLDADSAAQDARMWITGGEIFARAGGGSAIHVYDTLGKRLRSIELKPRDPAHADFTAFAVDPKGTIYVVESGSLEVEIFNPDGSYAGVFAARDAGIDPLPGWPECMAIDGSGNVYLAVRLDDSGRSVIAAYSPRGRLRAAMSHAAAVRHYRGIAVDALHNVYAAAPDSSMVAKFDPEGREICEFPAVCGSGIAAGADGSLYLGSKTGGSVARYFPSQVIGLIDLARGEDGAGRPARAEELLRGALELDNQLLYIHDRLGELYYRQRRWAEAMAELRAAGDGPRYSQTLEAARAELLSRAWPALPPAALALALLLFAGAPFAGRISRLRGVAALRSVWRPFIVLREQEARFPLLGAAVLIILFAASSYLGWFFTNPLFAPGRRQFSLTLMLRDLAVSGGFVLVWSLVAYKIGELFYGLARYSQVFAAAAYCTVPLTLANAAASALSHALAVREAFVFPWIRGACIAWAAFLFLAAIKRLQGFTRARAFGVWLLTAAATGLSIVLAGFLLGVNQQLFGFLRELVNELYTRAVLGWRA